MEPVVLVCVGVGWPGGAVLDVRAPRVLIAPSYAESKLFHYIGAWTFLRGYRRRNSFMSTQK